ncbi:PREDICTED: uncharacterized protein LOC106784208 [Polistes canadensis]|uniref:uncharacterized protein LOC106784208 n=1 Tax=Polistes canadensis TaxID=91411 RepID=UPI000718F844|nr:PREDICTED: uncharacterized protein LOC106784208 [Polistes canadensis]
MENLLCIRLYKREDEPYCKELARSTFMTLLNPLYTNFIIAKNRFQILLALSSCQLYWSSTSFPYFLMYPLIITCGIYIMLYLLFWKIVQESQKEVFDAARKCNAKSDKCFWVAEAYHYRFVKNFQPYLRYTWLTEKELQKSNINLSDYDKKIVGFIGVNKNVRINNCAMLNEFLVHNDYTRKGIGTQLIKTVLQFCDEKKYTRVNLQFFEFLTNAINLSKKLGFKYYETQSKIFFPLLVEVKMHEFSYLTQVTRPTDSIKINKQMSTKSVTQIQKRRFLRHLNF